MSYNYVSLLSLLYTGIGEHFCISICFINMMGGAFCVFFSGLPYSMKQAGFPLGILLLFWVSYITGKRLYNC